MGGGNILGAQQVHKPNILRAVRVQDWAQHSQVQDGGHGATQQIRYVCTNYKNYVKCVAWSILSQFLWKRQTKGCLRQRKLSLEKVKVLKNYKYV